LHTPRTWAQCAAIALLSLALSHASFAAEGGTTSAGAEGPEGGTGSLAFFVEHLVYGDVAAAGVGLRGTGTGIINLAGVPPGAAVVQAYLYWSTIGNAGTYTAPTLDGQAVAGTLIGSGPDTCWGATGNFHYRADVTGLVAGDGSYTVAGLPNALAGGNDSQGAALVAIWEVPDQGFPERSILIHDGAAVVAGACNESVTDTLGAYTTELVNPDARLLTLMGDGQAGLGDNLLVEGVPFGGADAADGSDGPLWDTDAWDVTGLVGGGPVTVEVNNIGFGVCDCVAQVADVLSVETGSVRSIQEVPALGGWGLAALALGLAATGVLLFARRRGSATPA